MDQLRFQFSWNEHSRHHLPFALEFTVPANSRDYVRPVVAPELKALENRLQSFGVRNLTKMDARIVKVDGNCITVPMAVLLVRSIKIKVDHVFGIHEPGPLGTEVFGNNALEVIHDLTILYL